MMPKKNYLLAFDLHIIFMINVKDFSVSRLDRFRNISLNPRFGEVTEIETSNQKYQYDDDNKYTR